MSQTLQQTSTTGTLYHQLSFQTSQTLYTPAIIFVPYNMQSLVQIAHYIQICAVLS